jgi:TPR repeat protein
MDGHDYVERALDAWAADRYAEARELFELAIRAGAEGDDLATAHVELGRLFQEGLGGNSDPVAARRHYAAAVDLSDPVAMHNLAWMMAQGEGGPIDERTAAGLYRRAAELGYAKSMFNLGLAYEYARGVAIDYEEAAHWFREAAKRGDRAAMTNIGYMHERGLGVARSAEQARGWYAKAAEHGDPAGLYNMGVLAFDDGDEAAGEEWMWRATRSGYVPAQGRLARFLSDKGRLVEALALALAATVGGDRESRRRAATLRSMLFPRQRRAARELARELLADASRSGDDLPDPDE